MSATSRPAAVSGRYAGMVIGLLLTVTLAGAGCGWQTPRNADGTAATSAVSRIDTLDPGSMKEFLAAGTPAVIVITSYSIHYTKLYETWPPTIS